MQGNPVQDSFRRGLGYAIQWYDSLKILLENSVKEAIHVAAQVYQDLQPTPEAAMPPVTQPTTIPANAPELKMTPAGPHKLSKGECARILQERCPACFSSNLFGRPWSQSVSIIYFTI